MSPEERQKLEEIYEFIQALKNSATIPFEIDSAVRERFDLQKAIIRPELVLSSEKTVASETQAVDEAGASTYNVPKIFDGYTKEIIEGTTIYHPYYA